MSDFSVAAAADVLRVTNSLGTKRVVVRITGPSSYVDQTSALDLSSANATLLAKGAAFTKIYGGTCLGTETAANSRYLPRVIPTVATPASTVIAIDDMNATDGGDAASGDLSSVTWIVEFVGT